MRLKFLEVKKFLGSTLGLKDNKKIDQMEIKPVIEASMIWGSLWVHDSESVNSFYK